MSAAVKVGSAVADYRMDTRQFRRDKAEIIAGLKEIRAAGRFAPTPVSANPLRQYGDAARKAALDQARLSAEQAKGAINAQRLAAAQQRTAAATEQTRAAAARAAAAESGAAAAAARSEAAQLRLAAARERAARAPAGGSGGGSGGTRGGGGISQIAAGVGAIQSAAGAVGIGLGAAQLVSYGVAAAGAANSLEKTEATLRAVAGSQARYNEILAVARQNQAIFGGGLNENLQPLGAFLQLSNRTGTSIEQLNRNAQLLIASAPGKVIGDAAFSISEFLSGNGSEAALSLADQFNLPKNALAELAKEGTTAQERLAGLEALLAKQGITSATLAAGLNTTAATYDRLGAAIDNATTKTGGFIAGGLEPAARGLTRLLGGDGGLDAARESFRQYGRDVEGLVGQAGVGVGRLFGFAGGWEAINESVRQGIGPQQQVTAAMEQSAVAGQNLATGDIARGQAATEAAAASRAAAQQSDADAFAKLQAAAAAETNAQRERELEQALRAAAASRGDIGPLVDFIVQKYDLEAGKVRELIGQYRVLDAARGAARPNNVPANLRQGFGGSAPADVARSQQVAKNSQDIILATGTYAQQLAIVRTRLKGLSAEDKEYVSLKTREAQLQEQIAQQQERAAKGAAGGKGPKGLSSDFRADLKLEGTEQEKLALLMEKKLELERKGQTGTLAYKQVLVEIAKLDRARVEEQTRALRQIEERTQDHYRRLGQMQEDFELRSSRDREDFELQKQRLLAEGRVFEARQLEETFNREQRRAAEDQLRARSRQTEEFAGDVARTAQGAGLDPTSARAAASAQVAGVGAPGAAAAQAAASTQAVASLAATAAQRPTAAPIEIRLQPQSVQLVLKDQVVGEAVYAELIERFDVELASSLDNATLTNPPAAGQSTGVSGPRP